MKLGKLNGNLKKSYIKGNCLDLLELAWNGHQVEMNEHKAAYNAFNRLATFAVVFCMCSAWRHFCSKRLEFS